MTKHLLLFSLLFPLVATAQNVPKKHLRFIPLGERPTWNVVVNDDEQVQQEAAPGEMPPVAMALQVDAKDGKAFSLRLREMTDLLTLKTTAGGVKLFEGNGIGAGKPWFQCPLPAGLQTLGILYRDNTDMTWLKPKIKVLPDDLRSFPHGQIRFVNVSNFEVQVILGKGKNFAVPPGKSVKKTLKVGQTTAKVAVKNRAGAYKVVLQNSITMGANQRIQAFFYKAQGAKPKSPIKFLMKPERYQAP